MSNIYAAPNASLAVDEARGNTDIFALTGRIGRVRWLALGLGLPILVYAVAAAAFGLFAQHSKPLADLIGFASFGLSLLALVVFSRRRCQDIGLGPVNLLLAIIPILNFYFLFLMMFKRGENSNNAYGTVPCRNSGAINAAATLAGVIIVFGIAASYAVPQYLAYQARQGASGPDAAEWQRYAPASGER